jgi:hypothetical protein
MLCALLPRDGPEFFARRRCWDCSLRRSVTPTSSRLTPPTYVRPSLRPDNDNDACPGPFCDLSEAAELGFSNSNASSTQQQQINAATAAVVSNAGVVATQTAITGVRDHIDSVRTQQAVRQISGATGGTSPGAETGGAGGGGSNLALGPSTGVPTSGTGAASGGGGGGGGAAAVAAAAVAVARRCAAGGGGGGGGGGGRAADERKPPRRMEAVAVALRAPSEASGVQRRGTPLRNPADCDFRGDLGFRMADYERRGHLHGTD